MLKTFKVFTTMKLLLVILVYSNFLMNSNQAAVPTVFGPNVSLRYSPLDLNQIDGYLLASYYFQNSDINLANFDPLGYLNDHIRGVRATNIIMEPSTLYLNTQFVELGINTSKYSATTNYMCKVTAFNDLSFSNSATCINFSNYFLEPQDASTDDVNNPTISLKIHNDVNSVLSKSSEVNFVIYFNSDDQSYLKTNGGVLNACGTKHSNNNKLNFLTITAKHNTNTNNYEYTCLDSIGTSNVHFYDTSDTSPTAFSFKTRSSIFKIDVFVKESLIFEVDANKNDEYCVKGYRFNSSTNKCDLCLPGCERCNSSGECTQIKKFDFCSQFSDSFADDISTFSDNCTLDYFNLESFLSNVNDAYSFYDSVSVPSFDDSVGLTLSFHTLISGSQNADYSVSLHEYVRVNVKRTGSNVEFTAYVYENSAFNTQYSIVIPNDKINGQWISIKVGILLYGHFRDEGVPEDSPNFLFEIASKDKNQIESNDILISQLFRKIQVSKFYSTKNFPLFITNHERYSTDNIVPMRMIKNLAIYDKFMPTDYVSYDLETIDSKNTFAAPLYYVKFDKIEYLNNELKVKVFRRSGSTYTSRITTIALKSNTLDIIKAGYNRYNSFSRLNLIDIKDEILNFYPNTKKTINLQVSPNLFKFSPTIANNFYNFLDESDLTKFQVLQIATTKYTLNYQLFFLDKSCAADCVKTNSNSGDYFWFPLVKYNRKSIAADYESWNCDVSFPFTYNKTCYKDRDFQKVIIQRTPNDSYMYVNLDKEINESSSFLSTFIKLNLADENHIKKYSPLILNTNMEDSLYLSKVGTEISFKIGNQKFVTNFNNLTTGLQDSWLYITFLTDKNGTTISVEKFDINALDHNEFSNLFTFRISKRINLEKFNFTFSASDICKSFSSTQICTTISEYSVLNVYIKGFVFHSTSNGEYTINDVMRTRNIFKDLINTQFRSVLYTYLILNKINLDVKTTITSNKIRGLKNAFLVFSYINSPTQLVSFFHDLIKGVNESTFFIDGISYLHDSTTNSIKANIVLDETVAKAQCDSTQCDISATCASDDCAHCYLKSLCSDADPSTFLNLQTTDSDFQAANGKVTFSDLTHMAFTINIDVFDENLYGDKTVIKTQGVDFFWIKLRAIYDSNYFLEFKFNGLVGYIENFNLFLGKDLKFSFTLDASNSYWRLLVNNVSIQLYKYSANSLIDYLNGKIQLLDSLTSFTSVDYDIELFQEEIIGYISKINTSTSDIYTAILEPVGFILTQPNTKSYLDRLAISNTCVNQFGASSYAINEMPNHKILKNVVLQRTYNENSILYSYGFRQFDSKGNKYYSHPISGETIFGIENCLCILKKGCNENTVDPILSSDYAVPYNNSLQVTINAKITAVNTKETVFVIYVDVKDTETSDYAISIRSSKNIELANVNLDNLIPDVISSPIDNGIVRKILKYKFTENLNKEFTSNFTIIFINPVNSLKLYKIEFYGNIENGPYSNGISSCTNDDDCRYGFSCFSNVCKECKLGCNRCFNEYNSTLGYIDTICKNNKLDAPCSRNSHLDDNDCKIDYLDIAHLKDSYNASEVFFNVDVPSKYDINGGYTFGMWFYPVFNVDNLASQDFIQISFYNVKLTLKIEKGTDTKFSVDINYNRIENFNTIPQTLIEDWSYMKFNLNVFTNKITITIVQRNANGRFDEPYYREHFDITSHQAHTLHLWHPNQQINIQASLLNMANLKNKVSIYLGPMTLLNQFNNRNFEFFNDIYNLSNDVVFHTHFKNLSVQGKKIGFNYNGNQSSEFLIDIDSNSFKSNHNVVANSVKEGFKKLNLTDKTQTPGDIFLIKYGRKADINHVGFAANNNNYLIKNTLCSDRTFIIGIDLTDSTKGTECDVANSCDSTLHFCQWKTKCTESDYKINNACIKNLSAGTGDLHQTLYIHNNFLNQKIILESPKLSEFKLSLWFKHDVSAINNNFKNYILPLQNNMDLSVSVKDSCFYLGNDITTICSISPEDSTNFINRWNLIVLSSNSSYDQLYVNTPQNLFSRSSLLGKTLSNICFSGNKSECGISSNDLYMGGYYRYLEINTNELNYYSTENYLVEKLTYHPFMKNSIDFQRLKSYNSVLLFIFYSEGNAIYNWTNVLSTNTEKSSKEGFLNTFIDNSINCDDKNCRECLINKNACSICNYGFELSGTSCKLSVGFVNGLYTPTLTGNISDFNISPTLNISSGFSLNFKFILYNTMSLNNQELISLYDSADSTNLRFGLILINKKIHFTIPNINPIPNLGFNIDVTHLFGMNIDIKISIRKIQGTSLYTIYATLNDAYTLYVERFDFGNPGLETATLNKLYINPNNPHMILTDIIYKNPDPNEIIDRFIIPFNASNNLINFDTECANSNVKCAAVKSTAPTTCTTKNLNQYYGFNGIDYMFKNVNIKDVDKAYYFGSEELTDFQSGLDFIPFSDGVYQRNISCNNLIRRNGKIIIDIFATKIDGKMSFPITFNDTSNTTYEVKFLFTNNDMNGFTISTYNTILVNNKPIINGSFLSQQNVSANGTTEIQTHTENINASGTILFEFSGSVNINLYSILVYKMNSLKNCNNEYECNIGEKCHNNKCMKCWPGCQQCNEIHDSQNTNISCDVSNKCSKFALQTSKYLGLENCTLNYLNLKDITEDLVFEVENSKGKGFTITGNFYSSSFQTNENEIKFKLSGVNFFSIFISNIFKLRINSFSANPSHEINLSGYKNSWIFFKVTIHWDTGKILASFINDSNEYTTGIKDLYELNLFNTKQNHENRPIFEDNITVTISKLNQPLVDNSAIFLRDLFIYHGFYPSKVYENGNSSIISENFVVAHISLDKIEPVKNSKLRFPIVTKSSTTYFTVGVSGLSYDLEHFTQFNKSYTKESFGLVSIDYENNYYNLSTCDNNGAKFCVFGDVNGNHIPLICDSNSGYHLAIEKSSLTYECVKACVSNTHYCQVNSVNDCSSTPSQAFNFMDNMCRSPTFYDDAYYYYNSDLVQPELKYVFKTPLNEFLISLWIAPDSSKVEDSIIINTNLSNANYYKNSLGGYNCNAKTNYSSFSLSWNSIVVTYDGAYYNYYVNGKSINTSVFSQNEILKHIILGKGSNCQNNAQLNLSSGNYKYLEVHNFNLISLDRFLLYRNYNMNLSELITGDAVYLYDKSNSFNLIAKLGGKDTTSSKFTEYSIVDLSSKTNLYVNSKNFNDQLTKYYLSNERMINYSYLPNCTSNCSECDTNNKCTKCTYGYSLSGLTCVLASGFVNVGKNIFDNVNTLRIGSHNY
jgi:hypothetical protein